MRTYDRAEPDPAEARSHPWTVATTDPGSRYHDLRAAPGLIRTALEDFAPWATWPAIEAFYRLLEWLNGAAASLESNDCAFQGPGPSPTPQVPKALEATGRLMILWRDLRLDLPREHTEWLKGALHARLAGVDPSLVHGAVGLALYPVRYTTLPPPAARQAGFQLMVSFWAWGDTTEEVMDNLERTFRGLEQALRAVDAAAKPWASRG
jgi:hypothetical protein